MVTMSLVAIGAVVVVFLVFVVLKSGNKGGRHNQSSMEAVRNQQNLRKDVDSKRAAGLD
jgi:hypothetical protein